MKHYSGGFSKNVTESHIFKNYVTGLIVAGYIGSSGRTKARDKIVEGALAAQGLGPDGIACWLTSGTGRHLMDGVDKRMSIGEFVERVKEYTSSAFQDVTIWSHPDHTGMLKSSIELRKKIFNV